VEHVSGVWKTHVAPGVHAPDGGLSRSAPTERESHDGSSGPASAEPEPPADASSLEPLGGDAKVLSFDGEEHPQAAQTDTQRAKIRAGLITTSNSSYGRPLPAPR